MRKQTFWLSENKCGDQLCSDCTADQHLRFRYKDSTIPLLLKSIISSFCATTAWFVLDLFENHITGFFMTGLIYISTGSLIISVIFFDQSKFLAFFCLFVSKASTKDNLNEYVLAEKSAKLIHVMS